MLCGEGVAPWGLMGKPDGSQGLLSTGSLGHEPVQLLAGRVESPLLCLGRKVSGKRTALFIDEFQDQLLAIHVFQPA